MKNSEITTLKLASIRIDGDTQLRAETNQSVIADYARDMAEGDVFPPVVVYYDGLSYWLSDGFHRYYASLENGKDEIDARVRQGSRRDALLYAAEANRKHGLSLSNKDKRRIVTLFLNDSEWSKWSDREIARRCGVSHPFVSSLRTSLEAVTSDERTYVTRHGTVTTMNVTRIGNDPYEGLSEYVVKDYQEQCASPKDIAGIAEWARAYRADIKQCAIRALLTGSWMLMRKEEGYGRKDDNQPFTQEQLEKEGWELWCLAPQDIDTAIEIGKWERELHVDEEAKGKNYFDVTEEDMLSHLTMGDVELLARWHASIVLRHPYTIWHYLTFALSEETKEKLVNGEFATLGDAYQYEREKRPWQALQKDIA